MSQGSLFTRRYLWVVIFACTLAVLIPELVLLHQKYRLFTGGFLQPYAYHGWGERMLFLALFFWLDLVLFGALGLLWFKLGKQLHWHPYLIAYNYIFFVLAGMGYWLAVKHKVLTYFNDTINFVVIRNLGGGSLAHALEYVAQEATLFVIALLIMVVAYFTGLKILRRHLNSPSARKLAMGLVAGTRCAWSLVLAALAVTVLLVVWINRVPEYRYGLSKTTAFGLISDTLDRLTDWDGDGFGLVDFPPDTNNLDATIHPGALDVPNNGIDEDGIGGDFVWRGPPADPLADLRPRPGSHILFIVLESTRADMLGKTWDGKRVTPNATAMAEDGSHASFAYTHTGFTTTSLNALFNRTFSLRPDRIRLTDWLDAAGYVQSFISGQDESFGDVARLTGMLGKDHYYFDAGIDKAHRVFPSTDPGSLRLSEARVVEKFRERVANTDWSRPNFFYVNLQAAHFPYYYPGMPLEVIDRAVKRSQIVPQNAQDIQGTYWNAVAVADRAVGEMIAALKERGVYDQTLVVIVADHGESLFDDGLLGHGVALSEIQTRIPLIVNRPGLVLERAIGQVDLAELMVTLATDRFDPARWRDDGRPQFQYIGSLSRPRMIGIVQAGEKRTILDFRTREVFFSERERWLDLATALEDAELAPRVRRLIHLWEEKRWMDHLARKR